MKTLEGAQGKATGWSRACPEAGSHPAEQVHRKVWRWAWTRHHAAIMELKRHHLLLLPGLDGTGRLFGPLQGVLPPEFEAAIVTYPPDQPLSYEGLLPKIREVMPWNVPYTIIAESFAGALALRFAAQQPQDIRAVILCAAFVSNPAPPRQDWAGRLLQDTGFLKRPSEVLLKKFLAAEECPEVLCAAVRSAFETVNPEVLAFRAWLATETDSRAALQACRAPILYLQAAKDRIVGPESLAEIKALKPEVKSVTLDAPHLLLQSRPREAFAAIREFLNDK